MLSNSTTGSYQRVGRPALRQGRWSEETFRMRVCTETSCGPVLTQFLFFVQPSTVGTCRTCSYEYTRWTSNHFWWHDELSHSASVLHTVLTNRPSCTSNNRQGLAYLRRYSPTSTMRRCTSPEFPPRTCLEFNPRGSVSTEMPSSLVTFAPTHSHGC